MEFKPYKTSIYRTGECLVDFILQHVGGDLKEECILAVTSKLVSLWQGRLVSSKCSKKELVQREADLFLGEVFPGCYLTCKQGLMIASAGIDESNSESGDFILYPTQPYKQAEKILNSLKKNLGIQNMGLILTDSHTVALRRGVTGVSLAHGGFKALYPMSGEKDLFGRSLKWTSKNLVDGLAAPATLLMGEGAECCPLVLIYHAPVEYVDRVDPKEIIMDYKEDLFYPLYRQLSSSQ